MTDPILDADAAAVVDIARRAIEAGDIFPMQLVIPDAGGESWTLVVPDPEAAGANTVGLPNRTVLYTTVGVLALALGAQRCLMVSDAFMSRVPIEQASDPNRPLPSEDPQASDAILVCVMAKSRWGLFSQCYHRDDSGLVTWDASHYTERPEPAGGEVAILWTLLQSPPPEALPPVDFIVDQLESRAVIVIRPGGNR